MSDKTIFRNICVFCSSSDGIPDKYKKETEKLGKIIALNYGTLIFGGCKVGLMGIIARSVKKHGGKVIGILPEKIFNFGIEYDDADELIVMKNMHERKRKMEELADAFIILPGGFGTLDELFEILTLIQTRKTKKVMPVVLYGSEYWNEVMNFQALLNWGMIEKKDLSLFKVIDDVDSAVGYLKKELTRICRL